MQDDLGILEKRELEDDLGVLQQEPRQRLEDDLNILPPPQYGASGTWDQPESINDPDIKGWIPPSVTVEDGELIIKKPSWWKKVKLDLKKSLNYQLEQKLADAEVPLTIAGGLTSLPVAGLAGLGAAAIKGSLAKGEEVMEKVGSFLSHKPVTETAKRRLGVFTTPLRWIHEASRFYGDLAYKKSKNPDLAATVATSFELASYMILTRGAKLGAAKIARRGRPVVELSEMQSALDTIQGEARPGAKILKELIEEKPRPFKQLPAKVIKPEAVKVEFADRYRGHLEQLQERVRQGEPGKRFKIEGTEEWTGQASTYPEFMKNKGWSKIEVDWSLNKGVRGEKLTPRQVEMFEAALKEAKEVYKHDLGATREIRAGEPQRITTGELEAGQKFAHQGKVYKVAEKTDTEILIEDVKAGTTESYDPFFHTFENARMLIRDVSAIAKDANVLLGEEGALSFKKTKLTPEQVAAQDRLLKDVDLLKIKAREAGKEFEAYLKDEGLPANMARAISEFAVEKGIAPVREGEELPKYAGAVNLEKITVEESLKRLESTIGKARPKKVQTWDKTQEISREILADPKETLRVMAKAKAGEALKAEEITAQRQINVNAVDKLKEMAEEMTFEEFNKQFKVYV